MTDSVFFVDAVHFVRAPFLGYSGVPGARVHPGARRAATLQRAGSRECGHARITVTHDTYITAERVCELLRKLAALRLSVPITLILDNARYPKCAVVLATAASFHIELCFLPAYSPNRNLIEHLWQFVKKQSRHSPYYADFAAFKTASTDCLRQTHTTTHKEALDSLLT